MSSTARRAHASTSSVGVQFFIDGAMHYAIGRANVETFGMWVFDQPFYVILNLAVGGSFDGNPQSDAMLPATMLVDYVRVYAPPVQRTPM